MKRPLKKSSRGHQHKSSFGNDSAACAPRRVTFLDIKKSTRRSLFQSTEDLTGESDQKEMLKNKVDLPTLKRNIGDREAEQCSGPIFRRQRSAFTKAVDRLKEQSLSAKKRQN